MSFMNLFGGDKKTTSTTTSTVNTDQSVTKTNSDNISNWLQQNLSQISTSTQIQNNNLEVTDSFNRTSLAVFADVGNIKAGTTESPLLDSVGIQRIFDSVLTSPIVNANTISKDPNANAKNFDFTGTSKLAVDTIRESVNGVGTFFNGVTDLSKVTSPTSATNNPNASPLNSPWFWPVIGAIAIAAIFLLRRR